MPSTQMKLAFDINKNRSISPIFRPTVLILGIFGSKKDLNETYLCENILNPILLELSRIPEKIIAPYDNTALGVYIEDWAQTRQIPLQTFEADFRTHGRSATIFRDSRIERECTAAIVFQAPRTTRFDLLAERMARKGKRVFFVKMNLEIEEFV